RGRVGVGVVGVGGADSPVIGGYVSNGDVVRFV
ncbi:unnamed protein product, partial [marine sediment metagenome]